MPSLFIGYYKALQENESKRGPIKQFEATPTQSLATSGRFAPTYVTSPYVIQHSTTQLANLSEMLFKLSLDSTYAITVYLSLFPF